MGAEGDDARSGQGRHVDDHVRLVALGIGEGVAQDQASLGVGVEDLDGPPGHRGDDVAGLARVAVGEVLAGGGQRDDVQRKREGRACLHRSDHARRAAHVELHLVHRRCGLDRYPPRVERDALPDEHDRGLRARSAPVFEDDEPGRLAASARHREQRAHAETLHPGLVEGLERHLRVPPGQSFGFVRQIGRRADVAGEVSEIAGEGDARGDRLSGRDPGGDGLTVTARGGERCAFGRRGTVLAGIAAHRVEAVGRLAQTFHRDPRLPFEIPSVDVDLAERPGRTPGAGADRRPCRAARDLEIPRRGHRLLARAAPDDEHAVRGYPVERVDPEVLAGVAAEPCLARNGIELAAARGVERTVRRGRISSFEYSGDETAGADAGCIGGGGVELHGFGSSWGLSSGPAPPGEHRGRSGGHRGSDGRAGGLIPSPLAPVDAPLPRTWPSGVTRPPSREGPSVPESFVGSVVRARGSCPSVPALHRTMPDRTSLPASPASSLDRPRPRPMAPDRLDPGSP